MADGDFPFPAITVATDLLLHPLIDLIHWEVCSDHMDHWESMDHLESMVLSPSLDQDQPVSEDQHSRLRHHRSMTTIMIWTPLTARTIEELLSIGIEELLSLAIEELLSIAIENN